MRRTAYQPQAETAHVPAPVGGLNTISAGSTMPAEDAVQLWNLVSSEFGLRSRLGSREWCTTLTGTSSNEVRTVIPYTGSAADGSLDRLFAVTEDGIWDVTDSSASPTLEFDFATYAGLGTDDGRGGTAGWGVYHAFRTSGGLFLYYADERNGLHIYTESTDTWQRVFRHPAVADYTLDGVSPYSICFVGSWKSRVWLVEKNTGSVWYLDAGAIEGTATTLNVTRSAQLRNGGDLVGFWNWTVDGGTGIDDYLVFLTRGGDVAVYQGTDPASADTFALRGVWSVGALPAGRRVASNFGGDVLLLTKAGIRPLSQLVTGGDGAGVYRTEKVGNLFNELTLSRSELPGWAMVQHPEDNALMVLVPTTSGNATEQLVQALWNRSWSRYRDLPIFSAAVWKGKLHFGTADGRVMVNDGYVDEVTLASPDTYTAVQWACLTAFRNLSNARQKQVTDIRPTILSQTPNPAFSVAARYNYNLAGLASVSENANQQQAWDSWTWDAASWDGDTRATQKLRGAMGMGTDVALAIRGTANTRTVLVGFDVTFLQGGFL